MRIQTKRTLQVALASGGLLMVGTGGASAAETVTPDVPASSLDQLVINPGQHGVADAVNGVTNGLEATQSQAAAGVLPAAIQQSPAPAAEAPVPAGVLHMVPVHLLQHDPAPSADVDGDLPEQDLNAPLGGELAATDLPVLPVTAPLTATPDTMPGRATVTPVDGQLTALPLRGEVSTQPLNPNAGTRVTGLHTSGASAGAVQSAAPVLPPAMPTYDRRADTPAAGLPLLGGLLPSTNGVLPSGVPALNGVSDVTRLASLTGLTQLAGSTPLTHGGRYNTGAVTAPLTQHGPGTLESATALLGK
ncbi:hypothetical protein [Amycolatopsis sp. NPDC051371]|uniref:hypothetical protein n=1 Tax=Amycolatopsis sp. NPDC051371 TaxID=3155800 RepID=UPI0034263023